MNKVLSFFFLLFFSVQFFGQNDAKLSIFNLNQMNFNPAYAGASDGLNVIGIYSNQWLGFEGAPKTQYLAIDSNLENRKIGIGFNLNSDQSGASLATNLESNFSYTVTINSKIKTTFGAKIGYSLNKIDLNLLNRLQPEEAVFGYDKLYSNTLILGAGLNIFTDNFFIGFSSPNFLTKKYYDPSFRSIIASNRNLFYTTVGYKFVLNREYSLTPTLLTRVAAGSRISTIASLNLNWQEKLLTGINLDYDASIGAYFAINAFKGIKVGYGYDRSLRKFNQFNNGSHTFFVNYYLENNNSKKCSCKL